MSTTTYTLSLARSENGNWSLEPSANLTDQLPPMAFPASLSALEARDYADGMLATARVTAPALLDWHVYGYAAHDHSPAMCASWSVTVQSLSPLHSATR